MYCIQIYNMNNDSIYKLKMQYQFYHQSTAVKYFTICNERINRDTLSYISSFINDYVVIPELKKASMIQKYQYSTTIDLGNCNPIESNRNIILNISVTTDKIVDIIKSEYINLSNNHRIMVKLLLYHSFNIENIV